MEVIVDSWNGDSKGRFVAIAEEFIEAIGQTIVIDVPHGEVTEPIDDDRFHIYIWSSPSGERGADKVPAKIWKTEVSCRDRFFPSSGRGIPIKDGDYDVAELIDYRHLYVHHDLVHHGYEDEFLIFRRLLEETVKLLGSFETRSQRWAEQEERLRKASRPKYIEAVMVRYSKNLEATRDDIRQAENDIRNLQQQLVKRIRERDGSRVKLEQLLSRKETLLESFGTEYDKILEIKGVRTVIVQGGVISVLTEILDCRNPMDGTLREIGKFRIEIYTNGNRGGIRWFNLTRKVDALNGAQMHPHIWKDGSACLGNIEEMVPRLIGSNEYAYLIQVAIEFVESVNTADPAGRFINNWPLKPEPNPETVSVPILETETVAVETAITEQAELAS